MDELFISKQAAPTTTIPTSGNDANLASIATSMLTAMSSKNTVKHADSDKEETINYNDMPIDVCEHYSLKNYPGKIIGKSLIKI